MQQFENENILIGISGGINSAAVLCELIESGVKPKSVFLFYAHFKEHSDDTFQFVKDQFRLAKKMLPNVHCRIERNSIIDFFSGRHMIPHPMHSPCSVELKIDRINKYAFENLIFIDLVGYVKHELKKRGGAAAKECTIGYVFS